MDEAGRQNRSTVSSLRDLARGSRRLFWISLAVWTLGVTASLAWGLATHHQGMRELARRTARALLDKDVVYRDWATLHGGVYVPVTAQTPPNPWLKVPERDLVTPAGRALTLVNPAYMTRQVFEFQERAFGIRGRITSSRPIRPENAPDAWERAALTRFEQGEAEVVDLLPGPTGAELRLMRPLPVKEGCLRCHGDQGYRVGQVRGGLRVTVPMALFQSPHHARNLVLAHGGLWGLGACGLLLARRRFAGQLRVRARLEREREEALAQVKVLDGLLPICAACKKIRDDQGYWHQVEAYVVAHSEAAFTHGLCPECSRAFLEEARRDPS